MKYVNISANNIAAEAHLAEVETERSFRRTEQELENQQFPKQSGRVHRDDISSYLNCAVSTAPEQENSHIRLKER
jgi:hypothetical protein